MFSYRERAVPVHLRDMLECAWISYSEAAVSHRVTPDGCADILFVDANGRTTLQVVGPMTRFADVALGTGQRQVGLRFRPGQWQDVFGVPGHLLTDRMIPLEDLWGRHARRLLEQLTNEPNLENCATILTGQVCEIQPGPVEHAIAWLEARGGLASLDGIAGMAGLSGRQFRRVCLERTGLSPKLLSRILRFRRALNRLSPREAPAGLAIVDR
jgi:hypothetical protein